MSGLMETTPFFILEVSGAVSWLDYGDANPR